MSTWDKGEGMVTKMEIGYIVGDWSISKTLGILEAKFLTSQKGVMNTEREKLE